MIKRIFIFSLMLIFLSSSRADEIKKVEEKNFTIKPGSLISLTADEGEVVVNSWDKEEVYVKMTKRAWGRNREEAEHFLKNITVKIFQTYEKLTIKEIERDRRDFRFSDLFDGDFWTSGGYGTCVDFELKVPDNINLKIACDEGNVEVQDIKGDINIEIDEGDVNMIQAISDDIQIYVDEGDIYLSDIENAKTGFINIETDEGDIMIRNSNVGELDVDSDEGDIIIDINTLYRSWISTDEGDIEAGFNLVENADYRFETDEGDVEISIPERSNVDVRLQTSEGRIDTEFDLTIYDKNEGEVVNGVIGSKSCYLKVYTDEGYIFLKKRNKYDSLP